MCQLTLEVDDEVLAKAEAVAEAENTMLMTLVRNFVESLAARWSNREKQAAQRLQATFLKLSHDMGAHRWTRESLYALLGFFSEYLNNGQS